MVLVYGEMVTALLKSETGQEGKTGRTDTGNEKRRDGTKLFSPAGQDSPDALLSMIRLQHARWEPDCVHRLGGSCLVPAREGKQAKPVSIPISRTEDNDGDDAHLPLCGNEGQAVGENGSAQSAPMLSRGIMLCSTRLDPPEARDHESGNLEAEQGL